MSSKSLIFIVVLIIGIHSYGQSPNVIIQVNDELIISGIAQTKINISEGGFNKSFWVDYFPGKLILSQSAWEMIRKDSIGTFEFQFDYYTFKGQKSEIKNFKIVLSKSLLWGDYLIINIYDFRDRKYRKWYGPYTEKDYLVELKYPNGPIYARYK
ncbi:hypothetical protein [Flagellimonas beolgyonensis]|uniref:hypothetical protein n=1 Tax=Flagellimonas beolgyonensis TaxID=864064 RepID=UPI000F8D0426|nr:hypothetical protein [Allomuricauda beolgyonensis]